MFSNNFRCIGNLTRDPELRRTSQGTAVVEFSVALNGRKKGDSREVEYVDFTAWDKDAEFISKNWVKGDRVALTGEYKTDHWNDKNTGEKRKKVYFRLVPFEYEGVKLKIWDREREEGEEQGGGGSESESRPSDRRSSRPAPDVEAPFDDEVPRF